MLDWLAIGTGRRRKSLDGLRMEFRFRPPAPREPVDPSFEFHVDNLERLKLCVVDHPSDDVQRLAEQFGGRITVSTTAEVTITALGKAFVQACTPPTGAGIGAHGG